MSDDDTDWRTRLEHSLKEIEALKAAVSQKLAGAAKDAEQEARKAWHELEPRVERAEAKIREATGEAAEQLEGMLGELKQSLGALRRKL